MANIEGQQYLNRLDFILRKINNFKFTLLEVNDSLENHLKTIKNDLNNTVIDFNQKLDGKVDKGTVLDFATKDLVNVSGDAISSKLNTTPTTTPVQLSIYALTDKASIEIN